MPVICGYCGRVSQDEEYCDYCNAELAKLISRTAPAACLTPSGEYPLDDAERRTLARPNGKVRIVVGGERYRVRWLTTSELEDRRGSLDARAKIESPVLPKCTFVEVESGCWIIAAMPGGTYVPWEASPKANPILEFSRLVDSIESIALAMEQLRSLGFHWHTFDPYELEDLGPLKDEVGALTDGLHGPGAGAWLRRLAITNLDDVLTPPGAPISNQAPLPAYAAPEIALSRAEKIGSSTDVFHLGLLAYYWIAGLMPDGFPGEGLDAFDFQIPSLRTFVRYLPEGIAPVIHRAVRREVNARFSTPHEFAHSLREAIQALETRRRFANTIRWDVGAETREGRAKLAVGGANEDAIVRRAFPTVGAELLAVTDGISNCDVGSGQLASMITAMTLESSLSKVRSHGEYARVMPTVCLKASETLLEWATSKGYADQLAHGADLMGATLTAAWLGGREMSICNLGDSRAYLVTPNAVEQLTVDGDLGNYLLLQGTPPEDVLRMGPVIKALKECIGGCQVDSDGNLRVLEECQRPTIATWPLLPGDVVVLCSDGLIEEDAFLSPEMMERIVRANIKASASTIAKKLVEAADAMQRVPSPAEPEGWGDNISCIVVKIEEDRVRP